MKHPLMRRGLLPWLVLTGLMGVAGCQPASTPQDSVTTPPAAAPTPAVSAVSSAAATPPASTPEVTPAAEEAAPETTETGTVVANTGPALALRSAQIKPEPASAWQEGQHYLRLMPTQPTSALPGQVEVTEFFWYGCPHCAALDPLLESWQQRGKAAYVSFVRVPIIWSPVHGLHARIYYTAQALGKLDTLHRVIFDEFQSRHHPLNTPEDTAEFFAQQGVDRATFQRTFTSQAVDASLSNAQQLALRFKVASVPLMIINGKYLTDVGKAGGPEKLLALINDLAAREHGGQR